MRFQICALLLAGSLAAFCQSSPAVLAPTPPMGWNSWDSFGTGVTEAEVKANAGYMAANLARHGWQYIVVDIQWSEPNPKTHGYRADAELAMDAYGRLQPAPNRFSSAADGRGFTALAGYVHSQGLKFGIHIMRGIPRRAVDANLPIFGSAAKAADVADKQSICRWNSDMYGVDVRRPGGQDYYDSIARLYAGWGVDFIKADDMFGFGPGGDHSSEIEALSAALKKTGRPIVLSLSPGTSDPSKAAFIGAHAQMWRISGDFWDRWVDLKRQFPNFVKWNPYVKPGNWPDGDMLPLGHIGIRAERGDPRMSLFTHDEQRTLMTLWSVARSPLMFGGHLPDNDQWTLRLISNDEVLAVDQKATASRQLFARDNQVAWVAEMAGSPARYVAVFNIGDTGEEKVRIDWSALGLSGECAVRDLWARKDLGTERGGETFTVAPHAAAFYRVAPAAAERAELKPAALFSDHMVLQSGMAVPVWGTAPAGERVTVAFNGQRQSAVTSKDGKWMVRLRALKPGGPFQMTIAGSNTITIDDVLVGEVWLGSGQSNMAFTVSKKKAYYAGLVDEDREIAEANYPKIRMFTGKTAKTYEPQSEIEGVWEVCTPETAPGFSAVGYLFARDLQKELGQPAGILTLAFGASTAESWIRRETVAADPYLAPLLDRFDAAVKFYREHPDAPADQAPAPPQTINARPGTPPRRQRDPVQDQHNPTVLFNGMINPAIPYAIRGVLWYQGESIVGGSQGVANYGHVQNLLIQDWRKLWGEGEFPFFVVQLAALDNTSNNPRVREQQAEVLRLPNTGMAVTIDIGDRKDVHPHNKAPLGERLARLALAKAYGRKIEYSGPVYESMTVDGSKVRLKFSHVGGGLIAKDGPLKTFTIAGADGKFIPADAAIEGDTIVVSSVDAAAPRAVRYAWENYPEGCNLFNAAGLPAAPFRTDKW